MKVPFNSTQSYQSSNNKPIFFTCNTSPPAATLPRPPTSFNIYEPKSVLDLRRSPSPPDISAFSDLLSFTLPEDYASIQLDNILNQSDDWEPLMRDLGLDDDDLNLNPNPNSELHFPEFSHAQTSHPLNFALSDQVINPNLNLSDDIHAYWAGELNFLDDLIRAAECLESKEQQLANVILERLNQQLPSPAGKPLQRAAFYFKEGLQSLISGSNRQPIRPASSSEVVQAIRAYKNFSNISPIAMFSNFTANQAILEAVDGSMIVHVIDFDIGFGGQWASFMKEIADRSEMRKSRTPVVRITAVVPEEYVAESRLIMDNLTHFASDLKIRFEIDFVSTRTFDFLSFKSIKFIEGEKIAVFLSPGIIRRIGPGFLNDLRQISPSVVVHVDCDGMADGGEVSLRRSVIDGLEFYSTFIESLDAANVIGGGDDCVRKIENFLLRPKIIATVEAAGRRATHWREAFAAARMRAVALSQFADFQAEFLLGKVQVRGFHVAKRQAEMVLCWHDRPLIATSVWRC
ncbi:scarecrow-like protein 15 [Impatiens glandulifera]|uniref:scarecrow-like protein 15 n=1 Tax=Impatiens glandulifera TaxID=253017 RepID=UPI001FB13CA6|nr:scarecrow-like protein 15 [Impatiens glandulifera]